MDNYVDILITNANVYDGDQKDPYKANIAISGDRIISVGKEIRAAATVIVAEDLIAAPGFIDIHNHSDQELYKNPLGTQEQLVWMNHNYITQGVTTIVTGNCGEGFPNIKMWKENLNGKCFGTNICHLIPYASLRKSVLGTQANKQYLGQGDIKKLKSVIEQEMINGAKGISSAFDTKPGCYLTTEEAVEYAKIVNEFNGIYVTHIRNESGRGIIQALGEAIAVSESSGVSVHISQFRVYKPSQGIKSEDILSIMYKTINRDIPLSVSQNPYDSIASTFDDYMLSHLISNINPGEIVEGGDSECSTSFHNIISRILEVFGPELFLITNYHKTPYVGKTIFELAEQESKEPVQVMAEIYKDPVKAFVVVQAIESQIMEELMPHKFVITSSNGAVSAPANTKVHPRSYGTFPRKIRHYALDQKMMSLGEALLSMTSRPADLLGLRDRGRIRPGYYADIVIFNDQNIKDNHDYLRPNQYSDGILHVIVNGKQIVKNGIIVGKPSGRLI